MCYYFFKIELRKFYFDFYFWSSRCKLNNISGGFYFAIDIFSHPVFNTLRTTRDKHQWMVVKFLT